METDTAHQQSEPVESVDEAINTSDPDDDPDDEVSKQSPSSTVDDDRSSERLFGIDSRLFWPFVFASQQVADRGEFEQVFGRFAWWQDVKGYRSDDPGKYKVSDKVLSNLSKKIEEWGGQMPTKSERKKLLPDDVRTALNKAYGNKLKEFLETHYAKSDKKGDSVRATVIEKDYAEFVSQLDRQRYLYPYDYSYVIRTFPSYWRRTHKVILKSCCRLEEYDNNLKFKLIRTYYPMKRKIRNWSRSQRGSWELVWTPTSFSSENIHLLCNLLQSLNKRFIDCKRSG